MNPIEVAAVAYMNRSDEADKLIRLRDALTRLSINAELRDNNTALMVNPPSGRGMPVWVFVGYGGQFYSWNSAGRRHPVSDLEGAAKAIAAYICR
ncbi:hypothetical protein [Microbispora sp. NPDC046933]|uniref:hypothetical protein n=1 Tax=Microbispora sp. NPDC046933 TaxID=3155618 RepID=UPI0033D21982